MKKYGMIALLLTHVCGATAPWLYVDFDASMQLEKYPKAFAVTKSQVGIEGNVLYAFFKNVYEAHSMKMVSPTPTLRIPKIIHQIWIGGPVPEVFKKYIQTWKDNHSTWEHKLWMEEDINKLTMYNRALYNASTNNGQRSDIARYEILYQFGGVYADMDQECLKPFDDLHHTYDFYIALQPLDGFFVQVGIGVFGSVKGHPLLKHCYETIKNDWHRRGATNSTGPVHFTKSFYALAGKTGHRDIALPASYFYPLGCHQQVNPRSAWLKQEAYAVHHWAKSWMPPAYRSDEFKTIKNYQEVNTWNL